MDWQLLLEELLKYPGYTQMRIANELKINNTTIMRIRKGITKEPTYIVGSKLISLYLKLQHQYGQY